jgi:hypothetical protein
MPGVKIAKQGECVRITTGSEFTWPNKFTGRKVTFVACPIRNGLSIQRGGRRGGITMCTAAGVNSKCLRAKDFVAFPGGGAKLKRGGTPMLNGYSKQNRRTRRSSHLRPRAAPKSSPT